MSQPTVIVGGGLAGISAGLSLVRHGPVLLADAQTAEAASVAAVAGLANPLMSQKANPVWRVDEALEALEAMASDLSISPTHAGLVRPATSWKQVESFKARIEARPDLAQWLTPAASKERLPWLESPKGTLEILRGGAWDIPALLQAGLQRLDELGASVRQGWRLIDWQEHSGSAEVRFSSPEGEHVVPCGRLILALGAGVSSVEALKPLRLHAIKGQLTRVSVPDAPDSVRVVSGAGYVVPGDGRFTIGSTYEHAFDGPSPLRTVSRRLLTRAIEFLPWLENAHIESETAGVRVTVPETRLPMVGPLSGNGRVWVVSGLGSKGLLTAPLIGRHLSDWLEKPEMVPPEIRIRYW